VVNCLLDNQYVVNLGWTKLVTRYDETVEPVVNYLLDNPCVENLD
jgi:hypothetical protein